MNIRGELCQALQPIVDNFTLDIAELIATRIEAEVERVGEALAVALSVYTDGEEATDVEDTKPVRDRQVARAAVPKSRVGRVAKGTRARADQGDRAPAVAAKVVRAASSTPRPPAATAARVKTCSKCGAVGFNAKSCGKTHNIGADPAVEIGGGAASVVHRDTKPANMRPDRVDENSDAPPKLDRFARLEHMRQRRESGR